MQSLIINIVPDLNSPSPNLNRAKLNLTAKTNRKASLFVTMVMGGAWYLKESAAPGGLLLPLGEEREKGWEGEKDKEERNCSNISEVSPLQVLKIAPYTSLQCSFYWPAMNHTSIHLILRIMKAALCPATYHMNTDQRFYFEWLKALSYSEVKFKQEGVKDKGDNRKSLSLCVINLKGNTCSI